MRIPLFIGLLLTHLAAISLASEANLRDIDVSGDQRLFSDAMNAEILYRSGPEDTLSVSIDQGLSFSALNVPWTTTLALVTDPEATHRLLALTDSGVFLSTDRGETWERRLAEPVNSGTLRAAAGRAAIFGAAIGERLYESPDRGASWVLTQEFPAPVRQLSQLSDFHGSMVLLESGSVFRREAPDGAWAEDPRWAPIAPLDELEGISFCGFFGRAGNDLWYGVPNRETPLVQVPLDSGERALQLAVARSACDVSILTNRRVGTLGTSRILDEPEGALGGLLELPDALAPLQLAVHEGGFGGRRLHYVVGEDRSAQVSRPPRARCSEQRCQDLLLADGREGFYVANLSLPEGAREGVVGITVDTVPAGGIHAGAVLPSGGAQPGFVSFNLGEQETVNFTVLEYTGQIAQLEFLLERLTAGVRDTAYGPELLTPGVTFDVGPLPPAEYVLTIRSDAGDPKGRFGISVLAASLQSGVSIGGWIDRSEQEPFVALNVKTSASVVTHFGDAYPGVGAGRPSLSVAFRRTDGVRASILPGPAATLPRATGTLTRVRDSWGNQQPEPAREIAFSPDGTAMTTLAEPTVGGIRLERFERTGQHFEAQGLWGTFPEGNWLRLHPESLASDGSELVVTFKDFDPAVPDAVILSDLGAEELFLAPGLELPRVSFGVDDQTLVFRSDDEDTALRLYDRDSETVIPVFFDDAEYPRFGSVDARTADAEYWLEETAGQIYLMRVARATGETTRTLLDLPLVDPVNRVGVGQLAVASDGSRLVMLVEERHPEFPSLFYARAFAFDETTLTWELLSTDTEGNELPYVVSEVAVSPDGGMLAMLINHRVAPDGLAAPELGALVVRKNLTTGALEQVTDPAIGVFGLTMPGPDVISFSSYDANLVPFDSNFTDRFLWIETAVDPAR
ncbi:MAG: hypothetical protein AAGE01_10640 [Pseudomonadota bacterium]